MDVGSVVDGHLDSDKANSTNRRTSKTPNLLRQAREPADGCRRSTWRTNFILTALFLCLSVAALDATIVSTAAPVIAHDLNSANGYIWIGGAYLLANCTVSPVWAKLSDIWGRRPILLSTIAVFIGGSIICATARNIPTFVLGRAVQGSAGGAIIMLVHICISDLFSVRQRSLVMGLTEGVWALAGGVGPVVGGIFASLITWRWCFWINLPICGVAFILILLFLDIQHENTTFLSGVKAIDWFGITSFLGCTLLLLLGLNFGGAIYPWSSAIVVALLVSGLVLFLIFIYAESCIAKHPIIPLSLLKQRSTIGSLLVTFFHGLVFMNSEYYLPLFFQSVMGATPLVSGLLLLPYVVSSAIAGLTCGFLIHRSGRLCELIWLGTLVMCLGNGLYILWGVDVSVAQVIGIQIISGLGSGLLFEPPLIAIHSQIQQQDIATATSTFSFARNVAMSLCIVVGGSVFQNSMDHQSIFLTNAGIPESVVEELSGRNAAVNVMIVETLSSPAQTSAVKQAFARSIRNMFILYTSLAFCAFLSGSLVKKSHLSKEHVETVTGIQADVEEKV